MLEPQAVKKPILNREELRKLAAISVILGITPIFSQLLLFAPINSFIWVLINQCTTIVVSLLLLFGLASVISSLLVFLIRRSRYEPIRVLLISLCVVVAVLIGLKGRSFIRGIQFEDLADRSKPLIAAIALYEKNHDGPPAKLEQLVPQNIDQIPHTGLGVYPNYEYNAPNTGLGLDASWGLCVSCPVGIFKFDAFYYLPTEKYPEYVFGGYLEPIRNWAYFHD